MTGDDEERARLRQELDLQRDLVRWIRDALYGIEPAGSRDLAATAEAAAAAQECYRIADGERDRPQTIAAHYAVVGVVFGFVDAALLAVDQVFECLDLRYDGELPDERRAAVDRTVERMRGWVDTVRDGVAGHHEALPAGVVAALRTPPRT